jgi:hypothetical protein
VIFFFLDCLLRARALSPLSIISVCSFVSEKHGVKLGFMSMFVRASSIALQQQPIVNAVIDGGDIVYRDYIDVSVAVATPNGLVVPVLRNTDNMSFADIEKQVAAFGKKARDGALSLEDMAGGEWQVRGEVRGFESHCWGFFFPILKRNVHHLQWWRVWLDDGNTDRQPATISNSRNAWNHQQSKSTTEMSRMNVILIHVGTVLL